MFQRSDKECMFEFFNHNNENEVTELKHIEDMFNLTKNEHLDTYKERICIKNEQINKDELKLIMEKDNFIFI